MRGGRVVSALVNVGAGCALAMACGGVTEPGLGSCPPGTETCACSTGDTCEQGLVCTSGICVDPSSEGGAGTGAGRSADADLDGIPDAIEGTTDRDGDGVPNHQDLDSDGDGVLDAVEGTLDSDNDGIPNFLDPSSSSGGSGGSPIIYPDAGGTGGFGGYGVPPCAGIDEPARFAGINLIIMLDKSSSMGNADEGFDPAERWDPVTQGLLAFFEDPGTTDVSASLELFPADGDLDRACSVAQYETPRVPLTSLAESEGGGAAAFEAVIAGTRPQGGTPTLPALQGAINYAIEVAIDDPADKTVVVFVTDGLPGFASPDGLVPGCENNDIDHSAAIARAAFEGNPRILTYVMGIGPSLDALDAIANAGGTGMAILMPVGDPELTMTTVQQELAAIRTLNLSCDLAVPEPPAGEHLDPTLVNLTYVNSEGENPIGRADGCPDSIGWQYSDFDTDGLPTMLELCPNTCAAVRGDVTGMLYVQFGCVQLYW